MNVNSGVGGVLVSNKSVISQRELLTPAAAADTKVQDVPYLWEFVPSFCNEKSIYGAVL